MISPTEKIKTNREKHVFLVLVDRIPVSDRVGVLDHTDGLTCLIVTSL